MFRSVFGLEGDEGVAVVAAKSVQGAEPDESFTVLEYVADGVVGQSVGGGHVAGAYLNGRQCLQKGEEQGQT